MLSGAGACRLTPQARSTTTERSSLPVVKLRAVTTAKSRATVMTGRQGLLLWGGRLYDVCHVTFRVPYACARADPRPVSVLPVRIVPLVICGYQQCLCLVLWLWIVWIIDYVYMRCIKKRCPLLPPPPLEILLVSKLARTYAHWLRLCV